MLHKVNNQKGFTLIEVMVASSLVVVIFVLVFKLILNINLSSQDFIKTGDEHENFEEMLNITIDELKYASNVKVDNQDKVSVLSYQNQKNENVKLVFNNGVMYQEVDGDRYEIAEYTEYDKKEKYPVIKENNKISFNAEMKNINTVFNIEVVLRDE